MVNVDVEIVAVLVVLADQTGVICLVDRCLQALALTDELAAHIDVSSDRTHGETGDQAALDQRVRIVAQDFTVFTGARFGFVGIDDEIRRTAVGFLRHEGPFQAGRETRTAAATQTAVLHFLDYPVATLVQKTLGVVPLAAFLRAFQPPVVKAVDVGEDTILILKHLFPYSSLLEEATSPASTRLENSVASPEASSLACSIQPSRSIRPLNFSRLSTQATSSGPQLAT
jgi:hypothetical protein